MAISASARTGEYIHGEASRYWVPSIVLTDRALVAVAAAIKRTGDVDQQAKLRRDLDKILEQRLILELELARKA